MDLRRQLQLLPSCLVDLVLGFAYNATLKQTKRSLYYILHMKSKDIHKAIINACCIDYSSCTDIVYYSRERLDIGFCAPFLWDKIYTTTPIKEFFVWFARSSLFNMPKIIRILHSVDWRKIRGQLKTICRARSRYDFVRWVMESNYGMLACSDLLRSLQFNHLRKYPDIEAYNCIFDM